MPENVANTIDAIQCMLYMAGYDSKFKKSEKLKKGVFKGRKIESDTRLKISFFNEQKTINFSICKLKDKVTGIHISNKDGNNYNVIFPEELDKLQEILVQRIIESKIV